MNLLVKIRIFGALFLGLLLFNSCEEREQFGLNSDDVAPVEFVTTEVGLASSIVALDSVNTGTVGRMLVGKLNDPQIGSVRASSYMAVALSAANLPTLTENVVLDSARFGFRFSYIYDTSVFNRGFGIELLEIAEEFKDTSYINSSTLALTGNSIGQGTVNVVDLDSTYHIDLDSDWANEILDGVRNEESAFSGQTEFAEYFPGFVVSPLFNTFNIFGLLPRENTVLEIFYSDLDEEGNTVDGVIRLDGGILPYFNSITSDRSSSRISEVTDLETEYTTPQTRVVHSGAGLVTKIDLSALDNFATQNNENIVNLAEIEIGPLETLSVSGTPPVALFLYITDERNSIIKDRESFRSIQEDGVNFLDRAFPAILLYDSESNSYKTSITSFVQAYIAGDYRREEVFLYPADMNTTVNAFVVDPSSIKLNIFYSELR